MWVLFSAPSTTSENRDGWEGAKTPEVGLCVHRPDQPRCCLYTRELKCIVFILQVVEIDWRIQPMGQSRVRFTFLEILPMEGNFPRDVKGGEQVGGGRVFLSQETEWIMRFFDDSGGLAGFRVEVRGHSGCTKFAVLAYSHRDVDDECANEKNQENVGSTD